MPGRFDELRLEPATGGDLRVRVRVSPGARREAVVGLYGGALKVAVRAPPERGRANDAVIALLAHALGLPRRAVQVVAGATRRDKTVAISGLDSSEVRSRLARASGVGD